MRVSVQPGGADRELGGAYLSGRARNRCAADRPAASHTSAGRTRPADAHTHTHTAGHTDAQQPRPQPPPSELTLLLQRRGRGLALPHRQETDTILGQGGQGPEGGTQGHVFPKSCVLMHRGGGGVVSGYRGDTAADRCGHSWASAASGTRRRRSEGPARGRPGGPAASRSNTCT